MFEVIRITRVCYGFICMHGMSKDHSLCTSQKDPIMNLVKDAFYALALEGIQSSVAGAVTETRAVTPAAQAAIDAKKLGGTAGTNVNGVNVSDLDGEAKFSMNGALSTIFARALNIKFAKVDPATGEVNALKTRPINTQGTPAYVGTENLAVESQSNDWITAAMSLKETQGNFPKDGTASGNIKPGVDEHKPVNDATVVATASTGVRAITLEPDEIIPIFQKPEDQLGSTAYYGMSDVVFYTDCTTPTDSSPMGEGRRSLGMISVGNNWQTSIESISVLVKLKDMPPEDPVQE